MKTELRIDNHQPVPLRPLRELSGWSDGRPVYLGEVWVGDSEYGMVGWAYWDTGLQDFVPFEFLGATNEPRENIGYGLNKERTLARLLQPGERLVLTVESE